MTMLLVDAIPSDDGSRLLFTLDWAPSPVTWPSLASFAAHWQCVATCDRLRALADAIRADRYQVASRRDPHGLTPGERACADLLCAGASTAEIAAQLGMTPNGVCTHLSRAYRKLGVHCAAYAVDVLTGARWG